MPRNRPPNTLHPVQLTQPFRQEKYHRATQTTIIITPMARHTKNQLHGATKKRQCSTIRRTLFTLGIHYLHWESINYAGIPLITFEGNVSRSTRGSGKRWSDEALCTHSKPNEWISIVEERYNHCGSCVHKQTIAV